MTLTFPYLKSAVLLILLALGVSASSCRRTSHSESISSKVDTLYVHDTIKLPGIAENALSLMAEANCLYFNCGNAVFVIGNEGISNISMHATQAQVVSSAVERNKFVVVPQANKVRLEANAVNQNGGAIQQSLDFCVIQPPKPEIEVLVNGQVYNGMTPISSRSNVTIRVKPDADFKARFPDDARYVITQIDLLEQRSLGAPSKVASFNGAGRDATEGVPVPLGNHLRQSAPGTKIYFKIAKVVRLNFQNSSIEENLSDLELTIGAMVK